MNQINILVVDDSPSIRKALLKQLRETGANVTQAEDGQQGLKAALEGEFDLIITDIEMPNLNGLDLCQRLKNSPATRSTPVIILSSLETTRDIDQGFKVGASAYISKSEAHLQLKETIDKVLKKSKFHHSRLILVVDDSKIICQVIGQGLEAAGFQVVTAENGKMALKRMQDIRPDLILSDIEMPEMNGIDFCKAVHNDPTLASIPFVIMSTNSDRAVMRRLLQLGASSYLVKPFNLEQVIITVEKLLSDHFLILLKEKERIDSERKMLLDSITSLVVALEARDPYTRGHSEAVAGLLVEMASRMKISQEETETLGIAGRLHDLGKIGVPDNILLKPGPLTAEEFTVIKEHPITGASILGAIPSLKTVLPVIRHHHERFDGQGYPHGLKGEQILLWARMTAVADTYHALISDRPYRQGLDHDEVLTILQEVRGTQLCPDCVDIFMEVISPKPIEQPTPSFDEVFPLD
jgi:response regulator RpfG family c-di-GMP phosphodiesterase